MEVLLPENIPGLNKKMEQNFEVVRFVFFVLFRCFEFRGQFQQSICS